MLIRFKKNDGTEYPQWEEKKLGSISEIYQPQTISQSECTGGEYPVYGANGLIGYYHKYNHDKEQVAICCRGASCGKVNLVPEKSWITGNAMVINVDKSNINKKYLYELLSFQNLNYMVCGSGQPQITREPCISHKVYVPSLEEQQKIADFLSTVDQKIEAQKSIVTDYEELKKGTMQKIFNQELRFRDDNGDEFPEWEDISVEDLIEEYNMKTTVNNEYPILSSTHSGIMLQNEYFNKQTASEDNTGYKIVPAGYFTYRAMSDTGKFVFNQQTLLDKGIVSPAYPVFKVINGNETFFRLFMNDSRYVKSQILMNKEGSTRFALSISKLKNLKIKMPCLEEQKIIADCLSTLDRKIEAEKKIFADLEELKKGLLQAIFN